MDLSLVIDAALWSLVGVLVIGGIVGLVLPAVPGPPIIFAGLLLGAWIDGFATVGWITLSLLGVLAALAYAVDFAASALGASRFGASPQSVWGAVIGSLVGIFFSPIGILLGPFVGAVLGEMAARRSFSGAGRAGVGATLGLILGTALKLALALAMIGIFVVVRFFS
jgi:uncharacterized protein YqgC (DUF456 family)